MEGIELFGKHQWQPLSYFGITHPFFSLDAETIIYTWIALGIIVMLALIGRWSLNKPYSLTGWVAQKYARIFMKSVNQSFHHFEYKYCAFIATLFTFIVICNCMMVIPTFEEPTKSLNTTVALALISFLYIQKESIKSHGIGAYLQEYFKMPLAFMSKRKPWTILFIAETILRTILNIAISLLFLPIELLGKFASILSLSFRLFGNIFGGAIISSLWNSAKSNSFILQTVGLLSGMNLLILLFFGIFEGCIQAFVFTILSLTYLAMAVNPPQHN